MLVWVFFLARKGCSEIKHSMGIRCTWHLLQAGQLVNMLLRSAGHFLIPGSVLVPLTKPLASLSQLLEQDNYHQLSLKNALCYLTLLVMGPMQVLLCGSQVHKHCLENNKLALPICINKLCGVPQGKGCLLHTCAWHDTARNLSSFQKS